MTIYTIGYTGTKPEQIKAIAEYLEAMVIDIRYSPRSRIPHWAKSNLEKLLGSKYLHIKEFGNTNYRGDGPITLAAPNAGYDKAKPILIKQSVILMCACQDVEHCHRKNAAEFVAQRLKVKVKHLDPREVLAEINQKDTMKQASLL